MTAFLEAFYDVWQRSPAETRVGLLAEAPQELQRGAALIVSAVLDALSIPGLTPANAAIPGDALGRHGPAIAANLTLANRATLQQEAMAAARTVPAEARTGLATLMAAFYNPAREGLCAMK